MAKIDVVTFVHNPDEVRFVQVEIEGHKLIIDLRGIDEIVDDARERIKQLKLNIINAPDRETLIKTPEQIRDATRKFTNYILNRNN
jgi:hypothetical protein